MSVNWPSVQAPLVNNHFYSCAISGVVTALVGREVVELTDKSLIYHPLFWGTMGIVFIVACKIFKPIARHNSATLLPLHKSNFQANDTDKYKARIFGVICGGITVLSVTLWPVKLFLGIVILVFAFTNNLLFCQACKEAVRESI